MWCIIENRDSFITMYVFRGYGRWSRIVTGFYPCTRWTQAVRINPRILYAGAHGSARACLDAVNCHRLGTEPKSSFPKRVGSLSELLCLLLYLKQWTNQSCSWPRRTGLYREKRVITVFVLNLKNGCEYKQFRSPAGFIPPSEIALTKNPLIGRLSGL